MLVAGIVIRRQRPISQVVFFTIEDEVGHVSLIIWPNTYRRLKNILESQIVIVGGRISTREGTFNIIVSTAKQIQGQTIGTSSRDWN